MDKITSLLLRQKKLFVEATDELAKVREALKENSDGQGVTAAVHKTEPLLSSLNGINKETEDFAKENGARNLYEVISAQPDSAAKDDVLRLFAEVNGLRDRLKRDNALTGELLKKSKLFVDFHINVASQVQAEHTYGPPGTAENVKQGRKVFVADA